MENKLALLKSGRNCGSSLTSCFPWISCWALIILVVFFSQVIHKPKSPVGESILSNLFHPFLGAPTSCQWIGGLVSRKICRTLCGFRDPRLWRSLSLPRLNQGLPPWRRWRRTLWRASGTRTFRWWEVWFCFASWNCRVRCFFLSMFEVIWRIFIVGSQMNILQPERKRKYNSDPPKLDHLGMPPVIN